jgi:hypothetical protein
VVGPACAGRACQAEPGVCIRPVQLRRTNLDTGEQDTVLVPCGHTLASVCPACADRDKTLRAAQCREGWHLQDEPDLGVSVVHAIRSWRPRLPVLAPAAALQRRRLALAGEFD